MILLSPRWRPIARSISRVGFVLCAVMFLLGLATTFDSASPPAIASANAGPAQIVGGPGTTSGVPLDSGGSATVFAVRLPVGAACTGDSASGGYRIQSYVVPAGVDPDTLTFGNQGPTPVGTGSSFRQPLFTTGTTRYVNITTGIAPTPGGGGPIPSTPGFSFAYLGAAGATSLPAGAYNVGLACTTASAPGGNLDNYWNVQMTFAADPADTPAGVTWTVEDPAVTTTTTTTTTTTSTTTTTTMKPPTGSSTTTTVKPPTGSSTTTATTTTTTSVAGSPSSGTGSTTGGTTSGGSPSGSSFAGPATLPPTGSSTTSLVVWGLLLVTFGRMAVLLGRKPKVLHGGP